MALEHLTFAEIATRNRMSKEFAKSLKKTPIVSPPSPEISLPHVIPKAPVEVPATPTAISTVTGPTPQPFGPNGGKEFPWGTVIICVAAVAVGGIVLYNLNTKKKEKEAKEKADRKHERTLQNRKYLAELERNPETLIPNPLTIEDYVDENF